METAQGGFSSLNPMDIFSQLGTPGLSTIDQTGSEPFLGGEHTALHELTSYADDLNQAQALTEAIRASRTDMTAAVPAQKYIEDTRNSKWTITNTNQGFSNQGVTTAYLSSAQCVDLKTTRLTGSIQISVPALPAPAPVPADDYYILPDAWPLMCFTYGLQVGQNGNVLMDPGTATDQYWLTQMRLAKKNFRDSDLIFHSTALRDGTGAVGGGSSDGSSFTYNTVPNTYTGQAGVSEVTVPARAGANVWTATFTIRPTHSFFNIVKTWPPNIPLKLIIQWNPALTASLIQGNSARLQNPAQAATIALRIHTIRSEELYMEPSMRTYIMNHFETGPLTNLNQLAMARTMNKATLFDPTFGIPEYNAANIGGIFQFEVFRLSSHSVSGNQFQIHPVLNGSARPTLMVIGIPNTRVPYTSTMSNLSNIQVLYNGQTVWDEPYTRVADVANNLLPLYAESARFSSAEIGLASNKAWWNYETWFADHGWIVVNIAPSHNRSEVQPNSSAPVEIRGQFVAPPVDGTNIRVGLFFDQTMLLQKNNTAIFSLPIY